eukprot:1575628-Rhodomonas_salina.2
MLVDEVALLVHVRGKPEKLFYNEMTRGWDAQLLGWDVQLLGICPSSAISSYTSNRGDGLFGNSVNFMVGARGTIVPEHQWRTCLRVEQYSLSPRHQAALCQAVVDSVLNSLVDITSACVRHWNMRASVTERRRNNSWCLEAIRGSTRRTCIGVGSAQMQ